MKPIPKTVVTIAAFLIGTLVCGVAYEMSRYISEYKDFEVYVTLAARAALQQEQDLYLLWDQSESLSDASREAARHSVISDSARESIQAAITQGEINGNDVITYCNAVEAQATSAGVTRYNPALRGSWNRTPSPSDSDIYYYLDELRLKAKTANANYNPMQFGLSYVNKRVLEILFRDNLIRLIDANYGAGTINNGLDNNSSNFVVDGIDLRGIEIELSGPKLIDLTGATKDERAAYEQIFGKLHDTGVSSELEYGSGLAHDKFADYILQYELSFHAAGWHNMRSVIGHVLTGGGGEQLNSRNTRNVRTVKIPAANGQFDEYFSIGLPWIRYDTNYTLLN